MVHIQIIRMELALMGTIHFIYGSIISKLESLTLLRVIISCFES